MHNIMGNNMLIAAESKADYVSAVSEIAKFVILREALDTFYSIWETKKESSQRTDPSGNLQTS